MWISALADSKILVHYYMDENNPPEANVVFKVTQYQNNTTDDSVISYVMQKPPKKSYQQIGFILDIKETSMVQVRRTIAHPEDTAYGEAILISIRQHETTNRIPTKTTQDY